MARRAKIALASYMAAALTSVTAMAARGPGVSPGTAGPFDETGYDHSVARQSDSDLGLALGHSFGDLGAGWKQLGFCLEVLSNPQALHQASRVDAERAPTRGIDFAASIVRLRASTVPRSGFVPPVFTSAP